MIRYVREPAEAYGKRKFTAEEYLEFSSLQLSVPLTDVYDGTKLLSPTL